MRQSTLIFVVLALGVASAATTNWAGNWKVSNVVKDKCQPKDNIIIAQREKNLYIEFVMPTAECATYYYGTFKAFPEIPEGDTVKFDAFLAGDASSSWKFSGTLKLADGKLTFSAQEEVKAEVTTLERPAVKSTVEWAGTWKIIAKSGVENLCIPKNEIAIAKQDESTILASWTWESSETCKTAGLEGKFQATIPTPEKNSALIYIRTKSAEIIGYFTISEKNAGWTSSLGGSLTFERSSGGSFFIIVLILLVVVVGGVLFIQKKKKDEELSRTLASNSRSHLNA